MVLVVALVVIAWGQAMREMLGRLRDYRDAEFILETNRKVDHLLQAAQNLAFERGRTLVLIKGATPIESRDLDFILARRRAAADSLDALWTRETEAGNPELTRLRKDYRQLQTLRDEVDGALAMRQPSRDPALAERWFTQASAVLTDLGELTAGWSMQRDRLSPWYRIYSRLKILSFDLRTDLGAEVARTAAWVASDEAMTAATLENIMWLRGRSAASWTVLDRERRLAANPEIDEAVEAVDAQFFRKYRALLDQVLAVGQEGKRWPQPAAELTGRGGVALEPLSRLMDVVTAETAKQAERNRMTARRGLMIDLGQTLASLLFGVFAIQLVVRRLLIPLRRIETQLTQLTMGKITDEMPPADSRDEMGRMQAAVLAFRDSLIERQKMAEKLAALSISDGLTGVANRRHLDAVLQAEWQRALRQGHLLALAMIDLDHFKRFNDHYGHLAGDQCLRQVASVLAGHAKRSGELVARYGGEEFAVILPGLGPEQAMEWAEDLRSRVAELQIAHQDSDQGVVTISCGVVAMVPTGERVAVDLIRLADQALYRAKSAGRNRVAASAA